MSKTNTKIDRQGLCSERAAPLSGAFEGWRHGAASLVACATLAAASFGCSATADEDEGGEELGTKTQALRCISDPSDPNCPWKGAWSKLVPRNNTDITHTWGPALCAGDPGWVTISVDSTNHYRVLQWSPLNKGPEWGSYGSTRTWRSKPACAMKDNFVDGRAGFVVAGKLRSNDGNNNKIMASVAVMGASGPTPDNPAPEPNGAGAFLAVSNTTYSTGGLPGMASMFEAGVGAVVLAFMGDDGRTIYAHDRNLPYHGDTWSARHTGPVLPGNWRVVYAPTVTRMPQTFQIVIHARNTVTGQDALFETHFYTNGSNTAHFSNGIGSPALEWTQLASLGTIDDDPWITYSSEFGTTAFFKRGTAIMETSLPSFTGSVLAVKPNTGIQFASSPAATADRAFDMGTVVVVARTTSNQIFFVDSNQDVNLQP
jgi:hypothetical protein